MQGNRLVLLLVAGVGLTAWASEAFAKLEGDHWSARVVHREHLVVAGNTKGPGGKLSIPPPKTTQQQRGQSGIQRYGSWQRECERNPGSRYCGYYGRLRDPCKQNPLRKECWNQAKRKNK